MPPIEIGTVAFPQPGRGAAAAAEAEADGYDVVRFPDTQNLGGDPFVQLALAARSTSTILLGTSATNPITRHAAVTANAILSIQVESGGRAILGLGRGDSSMGHIGRKPAPMATYRRYVEQVRTYLAGGEVDQRGFPSRNRWHDQFDLPAVPLDMVCSGPRSIALAATLAGRVSLTVGADPERIHWGLETAHAAAEAAGRDPSTIKFGVSVNTTVDSDKQAGLEAIRGTIAAFAHFSAMDDAPLEHQPERQQRVSRQLREAYDTRSHGQPDAGHAQILDEDFLDWFGVAGTANEVIARLEPLVDLGLDHLYLIGSTRPPAREAYATEVLPALRRRAG
ncbi:MAG: LLM class flavin-dependent oxidoreductase [Dehalococcoidia bacterium]|jgi:5,10-methylenetetrahydromethanopterin reductase|nr:LLM class flavin-dependent oxidoreductase [Dehalococcoidia bacterium]